MLYFSTLRLTLIKVKIKFKEKLYPMTALNGQPIRAPAAVASTATCDGKITQSDFLSTHYSRFTS